MRIAGVQAAPRYLDRKGTIEKAIASMEAAADGGAELVHVDRDRRSTAVFGE